MHSLVFYTSLYTPVFTIIYLAFKFPTALFVAFLGVPTLQDALLGKWQMVFFIDGNNFLSLASQVKMLFLFRFIFIVSDNYVSPLLMVLQISEWLFLSQFEIPQIKEPLLIFHMQIGNKGPVPTIQWSTQILKINPSVTQLWLRSTLNGSTCSLRMEQPAFFVAYSHKSILKWPPQLWISFSLT